MKTAMTEQERIVRIELARARAALERQDVLRNACRLRNTLTPAGLWHEMTGRRSTASRGLRSQAHKALPGLASLLDWPRRYPYIFGGASALLSSIGRRRRGLGWRIGLAALAGWRLSRRLRSRQATAAGPTARLR